MESICEYCLKKVSIDDGNSNLVFVYHQIEMDIDTQYSLNKVTGRICRIEVAFIVGFEHKLCPMKTDEAVNVSNKSIRDKYNSSSSWVDFTREGIAQALQDFDFEQRERKKLEEYLVN